MLNRGKGAKLLLDELHEALENKVETLQWVWKVNEENFLIHGTISKALLLVYYFNPFAIRIDNRFCCSEVIYL